MVKDTTDRVSYSIYVTPWNYPSRMLLINPNVFKLLRTATLPTYVHFTTIYDGDELHLMAKVDNFIL